MNPARIISSQKKILFQSNCPPRQKSLSNAQFAIRGVLLSSLLFQRRQGASLAPKLHASAVQSGAPNCPHKLTKTAGPLARRRSRLGRLRTARRHGSRTSLPPMLVQSRRPPRRSEPLAEGGFCSLE